MSVRDLPLQDLSFIDDGATVRVSVTREMAATADEIWAELADAPSWSEWFAAAKRLRWVTPVPHGVGSRREVTVGPVTILEEFIVWEPGERLAYSFIGADGVGSQAVKGGVEMVELRAGTLGHTVVTFVLAIGVKGPKALLGPLAGPGVKLGLSQGLAGLERRIVDSRR